MSNYEKPSQTSEIEKSGIMVGGNSPLAKSEHGVRSKQPPPFQLQASPAKTNSNGPIQRMTLFAHGFVPSRDFFGNDNRRDHGEVVRDYDYNDWEEGKDGKPGEGYWEGRPSPSGKPQGEKSAEGPGPDPEQEKSIGEEFAERLKDSGPSYYFDGSAGALSGAKSRMDHGRNGADELDIGNIVSKETDPTRKGNEELGKQSKENHSAKKKEKKAKKKKEIEGASVKEEAPVMEGENKNASEPVVVIGHSMGAAYAAGLTDRLMEINEEEGYKKYDVQNVYYLAPHQPKDIVHPSGPRGVQYSHKNDRVSSKGLIPFFSGSKLGKIQGISEYLEFEKEIDGKPLNNDMFGENAQRGGHNVGDHDYIFDEYEEGEKGYVRPIVQPPAQQKE